MNKLATIKGCFFVTKDVIVLYINLNTESNTI